MHLCCVPHLLRIHGHFKHVFIRTCSHLSLVAVGSLPWWLLTGANQNTPPFVCSAFAPTCIMQRSTCASFIRYWDLYMRITSPNKLHTLLKTNRSEFSNKTWNIMIPQIDASCNIYEYFKKEFYFAFNLGLPRLHYQGGKTSTWYARENSQGLLQAINIVW